jgi:hypothetical protein
MESVWLSRKSEIFYDANSIYIEGMMGSHHLYMGIHWDVEPTWRIQPQQRDLRGRHPKKTLVGWWLWYIVQVEIMDS